MSCVNMCAHNDVIIQGSTPTLILHLDYDISSPQTEEEAEYKDSYEVDVVIKYGLNDYLHFNNPNDYNIFPDEINEETCECQCGCGCTIYLDLSQKDTIKFKKQIQVQVKAKNMNSGTLLQTFEVPIDICRSLDRRVM